MSKKFKVGFTTLEECEVKNYAIIKADTAEEAKSILRHIIEDNGENPYASDDDRVLAVEWEEGKATDVVVSTNGIYSVTEDIYGIGETAEEIKEEDSVNIIIPMYVKFKVPVSELTEEQVKKLKKVKGETPACLIRYAGVEPEGDLSEEEIGEIYEDVVYPISIKIIGDVESYNPEIGAEIEEPDEITAIYVG
jgi:ribosomal protein S13